MQLFFDDDSRELQILNEEFLTESGNKEKVYKIIDKHIEEHKPKG